MEKITELHSKVKFQLMLEKNWPAVANTLGY